MTRDELTQRLQGIEWDDFEVKAAKCDVPKDVWPTVSAFSNTSGGWIVFGVEQRGKQFLIEGVENGEKIESDFLNNLRNGQKFNKVLTAKGVKYTIDGKLVLAFHVPSSPVKPIYFNSVRNTFIRSGSGDRLATESEVSAMYREQSFGVRSELPVIGSRISLLDEGSLRSYRAQVEKYNPTYFTPEMTAADFCLQIGAADEQGQLTYAGLMMLGQRRYIDRHIPTFWLDYIEIPGRNLDEARTRYTFRIEPQQNLWQYYRALLPRLRLFCNNEFRLNVDGVAEDDESQLECMREALANMCMHADQFSPIHSCIHAYTDRIEFMNAGSFAVPIATEGQVAPLLSRPRNPSLAKMFRLARLAETVGFGMKKIFTWKKLTGKEASIHSEIDYSIVTFYLDVPFVSQGVKDKEMSKTDSENVQDNVKMSKTDGDTVPVTAPVTAPDTAPVNTPVTKSSGKGSGTGDVKMSPTDGENVQDSKEMSPTNDKKVPNNGKMSPTDSENIPDNGTMSPTDSENVPDKENIERWNRRKDSIRELMANNPDISVKTIAETLGVNERTIKRDIKELRENGIIERMGGNFGGKWIIINKESTCSGG